MTHELWRREADWITTYWLRMSCGSEWSSLFAVKSVLRFTKSAPFSVNPQEKCPFRCDLCMKSFKTRGGLVSHFRIGHRQKKAFCRLCLKFLRSEQQKKHHQKQCNATFECEFCPITSRTADGLEMHTQKVHPHGISAYCQPCKLCLRTPNGLAKHRAMKHGVKNGIVWCPFCETTLGSKARMKPHRKKCPKLLKIASIGLNPKQYKTKLCISFENGGYCRRGGHCAFAHGLYDLRRSFWVRAVAREQTGKWCLQMSHMYISGTIWTLKSSHKWYL